MYWLTDWPALVIARINFTVLPVEQSQQNAPLGNSLATDAVRLSSPV